MDFIDIWPDDRYRSKDFVSAIAIRGYDLEVKVTDFKFSYKSQCILHLSLYGYISSTFDDFH